MSPFRRLGPAALLLLAADATAQSLPVLDGAQAPAGGGLPREEPTSRGLGLTGLFPPQVRTDTAPVDAEWLLAQDDATPTGGPLRMGVVQDFPAFDTDSGGTWTPIFGGEQGWLWTASFRAPDARGVRVRLASWDPPAGAELYVANADRPDEVFGPLTREHRGPSGTLWTPTIYGEEVQVELFLPPPAEPADVSTLIVIDGLLHQYRLPGVAPSGGAQTGGGYDGGPLSCHLDVTCYPAWSDDADGVGILSYVSSPGGFFCSGAMLNRVGGDFTPMFATARHCGVTDANADSLLVTWLYRSTTCNGSPPAPSTLPASLGYTVLVQDADTDYTLVGLNFSNLGFYYFGWDANSWATGSSSIGIHHPAGSWQRISFGSKTANDSGSCVGGNAFHRITWPNGSGEIEPGSSGSPILDSSARVRGTASCATWSCSSSDFTTYGKFEAAYPELAPYLNPTNPIYVNVSASGTETGTNVDPFNELIEGAFAVLSGSTVNVTGGTYDLEFAIQKPMTINAVSGTVVIR